MSGIYQILNTAKEGLLAAQVGLRVGFEAFQTQAHLGRQRAPLGQGADVVGDRRLGGNDGGDDHPAALVVGRGGRSGRRLRQAAACRRQQPRHLRHNECSAILHSFAGGLRFPSPGH